MAAIVYCLLVGILVFLVSLVLLPALTLPADPWAVVLGILAGLVVFLRGRF